MPRIKRVVPAGFTTVSNDFLRDVSLSLAARGLLMTMLSLPDGWNMSGKGFAAILPDGRDKVYSTLNILEEKGYLQRKSIRENGKFVDVEYQFCDSPIFTKCPVKKKKIIKRKANLNKQTHSKTQKFKNINLKNVISDERKSVENISEKLSRLTGVKLKTFISDEILEYGKCVSNFNISPDEFDTVVTQFIHVYQDYPETREKLTRFSSADVACIAENAQEFGNTKKAAIEYFINEKPILEI